MVAAHAFQHETGEGTVHPPTSTTNTLTSMGKVGLKGLEASNNPALLYVVYALSLKNAQLIAGNPNTLAKENIRSASLFKTAYRSDKGDKYPEAHQPFPNTSVST